MRIRLSRVCAEKAKVREASDCFFFFNFFGCLEDSRETLPASWR